MMKKTITWTLSVLITLIAALYQRWTGPSYPTRGTFESDGVTYRYKMLRTETVNNNLDIRIPAPEGSQGTVYWKRYPTSEPFSAMTMEASGDALIADLPHQPPAGKLQYYVVLTHNDKKFVLPAEGETIIARYKGAVPSWIIIPHVFFMFFGMLISNRAGIGALAGERKLKIWSVHSFIFLVLGGFGLGCPVQYYAFGQAWTGFPLGYDLTDNKLAIAVLAWSVPFFMSLRKDRELGLKWVVLASVVTFLIFMIPHSMFGSQYKYE